MIPTKLELEESFTSWLAACDEMLTAGLKPSTLDEVGLEPELRSRLSRGVSCLERLQELWTRPRIDPAPFSEAEPLIRVGRFEIIRELGRGGFGVVYLAKDTELQRDVALKIPRLDVLLSPELRNRFHHEAVVAARLDHRFIVPVYEAGAVGIVSYIASAYCPGVTLAAWLKEQTKPVPWRAAALLVANLADAIQHAHSRGVLHRDLKPGNVLLQESGIGDRESGVRGQGPEVQNQSGGPHEAACWSSLIPDSRFLIPRITDFGLAKLPAEDGRDLTATGSILGTASYMAPEQAEGKLREIGTATDIYSLGAILYELLTDRPPFEAEAVLATLEQVRTAEPITPRKSRPDVPADLETICLKCLAKRPERRYGAAGDLADDLRRFLAGEPIRARPVGWLERAWKWTRRHPVWTVAGLIALVVLTAAAGDLERQRRQAIHQRQEQRAALRELVSGMDYLLTRESNFDVRPGVPHNAFTHLERLYAELEAAPENLRDPGMRHELARAARLLGVMQERLGNSAEAIASLRHAIDLLDALAADFPQQRAYHVDLAVTLCMLAERSPDDRQVFLSRAHHVVQNLANAHPDQPAFRREAERIAGLLVP